MLELDCFVRSSLFNCPLSYTFLGFVGIQEFGLWSSIHLSGCKSELWPHVQFHMHYVAISLWTCGIAFFLLILVVGFWVFLLKTFRLLLQRCWWSYDSAWGWFTCLSLSPLVFKLTCFVRSWPFFLPSVPHTSLSIKNVGFTPIPPDSKRGTSFTLYALICKYM